MKVILLLSHMFRVYSVDLDNDQYNYLLKTIINEQEYLIAYNSKNKYAETDYVRLSLKVECEGIRGLSIDSAGSSYGSNICIVLEEK